MAKDNGEPMVEEELPEDMPPMDGEDSPPMAEEAPAEDLPDEEPPMDSEGEEIVASKEDMPFLAGTAEGDEIVLTVKAVNKDGTYVLSLN